jgi:protocatechuate 3,4-dioxygenase, beta subunit
MTNKTDLFDRRRFLTALAAGTAALHMPSVLAQVLLPTARQSEGPFYPDRLPLDTDNDLIIIGDHGKAAVGEITHLTGRILDARGTPVTNALIEIWQVDNNGVYLHPGSSNAARRDANFQGYGRFETAAAGEYRFRTIKPVSYPGRAPHIHVKVSAKGRELLTTQLYVQGHPQNDRDGLLNSIRDPKARAALVVPFIASKGSAAGELAAQFDIVLGKTPTA